ncbi:hypothetical protein PR202_ga20476 [Eleusine coracana subsp. coracana]|uniref:CBS domain-containing protein n=1 Tax=Eleusine coracana subsp. coracana TaxID=191504 RepID=A0AAV5CYS9_ELECO|nr:hypothetical protein PR202_ga20476 [Eleusine coracana subsp. coracana]
MVLRQFSWPYGGRQASLCGSFTGWRDCPMALVGTEFQVVFDLPPGVYQPEPSSIRGIDMDEGTILTTMPPEPQSQNSGVQLAVFRHRVSEILLHSTIYDVVPISGKLAVLDAQLPVKQAFKIMHDELQRNIRSLGHEELEMHPISLWKEAKLQFYVGPDGTAMQRRPLVRVKDSDNLVDVALTIIRNEISSVPIFKSLPDSSRMPVLNLATLPGILKFLCSKLQEEPEGCSFLQSQIVSIPIGTWAPHTGRSSNRQLRTLQLSSPLNTCLDLLLQDGVSSIPIVDDNGSFRDVYSLSDIMALAKNDVYARIELEQVTVQNVNASSCVGHGSSYSDNRASGQWST